MGDADKVVFGVPLITVMARAREKTIPSFLKKLIRYLNAEAIYTEGLFRISVKSQQIQGLKARVNAGEDVEFNEVGDHHVIAGVLKTYLRELPEPLFPFDLYPKLISAAAEYEKLQAEERASASIMGTMGTDKADTAASTQYLTRELSNIVSSMPPPHKALAELLLLFLSRVGEHSSRNKMTPSNLAIVFGQTLLRPEVESVESMMNSSKVTGIVRFMIEHFDQIFPNQKTKLAARRQSQKMIEGLQQLHEKELNDKQKVEEEKLAKIKETVDDAICHVQKKLNTLSTDLKDTDSLEVAIDIARRVRTAKKILFEDGKGGVITLKRPTRVPGSGAASGSSSSSSSSGNSNAKKKRSGKKKRDDAEVAGLVSFLVGHASLQGKRNHMEDNHAIIEDLRVEFPELSADKQWSFFAVYDGHGGSETSLSCSRVLHKHVAKMADFSAGRIIEALQKGFISADETIIQEGQQRGFKDGSTAVVAVIHDGKIFIANAGDSEAILCRRSSDGKVEHVVLTEKHLATNEKERKRIEDLDGAIFSGRVFGALAISRALGDRDYKIPTSEANFVTAEPFTTVTPISDDDQFLLLACDGMWEKFSYSAACDFVLQQFANGSSVDDTCLALANEAIALGSMDNVTALIVKLN